MTNYNVKFEIPHQYLTDNCKCEQQKQDEAFAAAQQIAAFHRLSAFRKPHLVRQQYYTIQFATPSLELTLSRLSTLHANLLSDCNVGLLTAFGAQSLEEVASMLHNFWQEQTFTTNERVKHLATTGTIHTNELPHLLLTQWCLPKGCRRNFTSITSSLNNHTFNTLWNAVVDLHTTRTFI